MKEESYEFFKSICSFSEKKLNESTLIENAKMIVEVYENFLTIEKLFFDEYPPALNFKKLVDFNYTFYKLNNFSYHECFDDYDINWDGGLYEYEEERMGNYNNKLKNKLIEKGIYFPLFNNQEDDNLFATYDLDRVKKSFKIVENDFNDLIEFSKYHVEFIIKNDLRFLIKSSIYDQNQIDGFEEFKIWVYKFSSQWDFKDHNTIEGLNDGMNEVWSTVNDAVIDLADVDIYDENGIPLTEYCEDDTENFNVIKFLDKNFNF